MSKNVTTDALLGGKVTLTQPRRGYRAGLDAVILAASVPARAGQKVADIGSGVGAVSLCLAARVEKIQITAIERDPWLAELAQQNADLNKAADRMQVLQKDISQKMTVLHHGFHHVVTNPPYGEKGMTILSDDGRRAASLHETEVSLKDWLGVCRKLLKPKGTLTLIHRADRIDDICAHLHKDFGDITIFPLWPYAEEPAKRAIVRAREGVKTGAKILPGLVLHDEKGLTMAAEEVLRNAAALF